MPDKALELENVSFAYNGGEEALTGVSLSVDRGAFLTIIGPNGGGKTTLVKILLGLLKPSRGTVRVLGDDPARVSPSVGYVPQHSNFEAKFPITVKDVVLLGLDHSKRHRLGVVRRHGDEAMAALKRVDMEGYASRRFDTLSGGQRQRVLVARAMVSSPDLLLFDEPMSNIDPHGKVCLFDILAHLNESVTVAMVSHDILSASAGITDVAVVNKRLIQGREVTPEMLELLYGVHGDSCPLDGYLKTLSVLFETQEHDHA